MVEGRPFKSAAAAPGGDEVAAANGGDEITLNSPLRDRLAEIERRVSAAFSSDMASSALANLCQQLGYALIAADEFAKAEQKRALDPTQSLLSPREARQIAEDAVFQANRLRTMVPRLSAHFQKVYSREQVARYLAKLGELSPERDALAQELRATYQEATGKLIDLFARVRAIEQRARLALGDPPPNCAVLARLDTRAIDKTTLPDWQHPDKNVWPPPASFAADYVLGMGVPQHPGAAWCDPEFISARQRAITEEQDRLALHAQARQKEQQDRENRELKSQWQRQHGQQQGG